MSYTALVVNLDSNHLNFHAPEDLGLYKALSKFTTIAGIYILDYTLPLVAKFSKSLQTKQLDLSLISSLIDVAIIPSAYWVLELLNSMDHLQQATGEIVSADMIHTFQEIVWIPFLVLLKEYISSQLATHDIISTGHS